MNKKIFILLSFIFLIVLSINVFSDDATLRINYILLSNANIHLGQANSNDGIGSNFSVITPFIPKYVLVNLSKTGTPSDNLSAWIISGSGTNYTVLARSNPINGSILNTTYNLINFSFSTNIMLNNGQYILAVVRNGSIDISNYYLVRTLQQSGSSGEIAFQYDISATPSWDGYYQRSYVVFSLYGVDVPRYSYNFSILNKWNNSVMGDFGLTMNSSIINFYNYYFINNNSIFQDRADSAYINFSNATDDGNIIGFSHFSGTGIVYQYYNFSFIQGENNGTLIRFINRDSSNVKQEVNYTFLSRGGCYNNAISSGFFSFRTMQNRTNSGLDCWDGGTWRSIVGSYNSGTSTNDWIYELDLYHTFNSSMDYILLSLNNSAFYDLSFVKNYHFNVDLYNQDISNNVSVVMFQSQINLSNCSEKVTGNALNCSNQSVIYPNAGDYNFTNNVSGYFGVQKQFTIYSFSNRTLLFDGFYSSNVSLGSSFYNLSSSSCNYTISNSSYLYSEIVQGTPNSSIGLINGSYLVNDSCSGEVVSSVNLNVSNSSKSLSFLLYPINSVLFSIFDSSNLGIFGYNVTATMIGLNYYYNYIINGSLFANNVLSDTYKITVIANASGYTPIVYYLTKAINSSDFVNIYMEQGLSTITYYLFDYDNGNTIVGASMNIYRNINGSITLVGSCVSDIKGTCTFYLNPYVEYQINISASGYKLLSGTSSPVSSPINLYLLSESSGVSFSPNYFNSVNVFRNIYFDNFSNGFVLNFSDSSSLIDSGCLYVYNIVSPNKLLVNNSCVNNINGNIFLGVINSSGTSYVASAYVYYGDYGYFIGEASHSFPKLLNVSSGKKYRLFLVLLVTIPLVLLAMMISISAGILVAPLPLIIFSMIDFIDVNKGYAIGLELVAIVIVYWINRRT